MEAKDTTSLQGKCKCVAGSKDCKKRKGEAVDKAEAAGQVSIRIGQEAVREARKKALTVDGGEDDEAAWMSIPRYSLNELSFGQLLGRGGFCDVYELGILNTCTSSSSPPHHCHYAIKHLSTRKPLSECSSNFVLAAMDLAYEAKILAKLSHPNIVKLRGLPTTDLEGLNTGKCTGYFIILDRLDGTLEDAFHDVEGEFGTRRRVQLRHLTYQQQHEHWIYRMKVARDIARAVAYIHERNILYRDLVSARMHCCMDMYDVDDV